MILNEILPMEQVIARALVIFSRLDHNMYIIYIL